MSRFKIGQKVVALSNHSQRAFKKGDIYAVISKHKGCCSHTINIGVKSRMGRTECSSCGNLYNSGDIWPFNEKHFAPLDEDGSTKKLARAVAVKDYTGKEEIELERIDI